MRPMTRTAPLALAAALLLLAGAARGQDAEDGHLTTAAITSRVAAVEADRALEEAERTAAVAAYEEAIAQLATAEQWAARRAELARSLAEAPARLAALREELAQPLEPAPIEVDGLEAAEQALAQAELELGEARTRLADLREEPARRTRRRGELTSRLAAVRQRLSELDELLATPAAPDAAPSVVARRTLARARRRALRREAEALELEQQSLDARSDLLQARLDKARRAVEAREGRVGRLRDLTAELRRSEAEAAQAEVRRLRREALRRSPALAPLAAEIQALAAEGAAEAGTTAQLEVAANALAERRTSLAQLRERFASTRRKVEAVGLSSTMGLLLRSEYDDLPDADRLEREALVREEELAEVQFELIVLRERREAAGDVDAAVERVVARAGSARTPTDRAELEAVAREVFETRRELLDARIADLELYLNRLLDLVAVTRELAALVVDYRLYVEERILWVRSIPEAAAPELGDLVAAARWLTTPTGWSRAAVVTGRHALERWILHALWALLVAGLFPVGRWAGRRAEALRSVVRGHPERGFGPSLAAGGWTLVAALPWPVLVASAAALLAAPARQAPVALAASAGLFQAAWLLTVLEPFRHALRPGGLAEGHLRWRADGVRRLRRVLLSLEPLLVGVVVLVIAFEDQPQQEWRDSLGRAAFVAGALSVAAAAGLALRPQGPVLKAFLASRHGSALHRLRPFWYGAVVGVPLVLAALAAQGYYYTAVALGRRLILTLGLVLAAVLLHAVVTTWLAVTRRRLQIEEARRAREEADEDEPDDHDELDLKAVSDQAKQLLRTVLTLGLALGTLAVWANALPALNRLDSVQVYPEVRTVDLDEGAARRPAAPEAPAPAAGVQEPGAAPGAAAEGAPAESAAVAVADGVGLAPTVVTLADLALALLAAFLTAAAARNLPGLLEMVLLERLPLDAGARYAVSALFRYTVVVVGLLVTFGLVGIGWSKVQWLAAALTFGLGFGLQAIFANFVSGLIIFFERPIRVGDMVTVGQTTGVVTRIKIRATTVKDYHYKELVIPNQAFVTGEVVNWSLSDPTLRLVLPVGVAYGSDTRLARDTLLEVAKAHPRVLDDHPPPRALFLGFGDSSLDLELHAAIRNPEERWAVRDELHDAIDAAFRARRIEIAFPQRDLHVRSAPGLAGLVGQGPPAPGPAPGDPAAGPEDEPGPGAP